jgi:hypothetical protein
MSTMEYGYFSIQRHDMTSRSVLSRGQHSFWRRMDNCHIFTASMGMSFLCYLVTSRDDVSASRKYSSIEAMHAVKPLLMNIEKVSLPGCQECNYRFSVIKDCVSFWRSVARILPKCRLCSVQATKASRALHPCRTYRFQIARCV